MSGYYAGVVFVDSLEEQDEQITQRKSLEIIQVFIHILQVKGCNGHPLLEVTLAGNRAAEVHSGPDIC